MNMPPHKDRCDFLENFIFNISKVQKIAIKLENVNKQKELLNALYLHVTRMTIFSEKFYC